MSIPYKIVESGVRVYISRNHFLLFATENEATEYINECAYAKERMYEQQNETYSQSN